MIPLPPELSRLYTTGLARHGVVVTQQPHYRKWLRYYWDFCQKYGHTPTARQSFPAFGAKLRSKRQSEAQCHEAEAALALYYDLVGAAPATEPLPATGGVAAGAAVTGVRQGERAVSPARGAHPGPRRAMRQPVSHAPRGRSRRRRP